MKPQRLELRGFTAFRETAVVDFADRSLFAITGPTGAGKSSLLDAMIWALYGQVPRVGRATRQLITHGEKSMAVRFDFTARSETYRVARSTSGPVGTRLEQQAEDGKSWRLLADRAADVVAQVTAILGLDYQTFTRTIVLPQGEFHSFLRGEERERREILSRLLGIDTYVQAGRAARMRAVGAKQLGETLASQLERLSLATPEAIAALDAERERLEASAEQASAQRERLTGLGQIAERYAGASRAAAAATQSAEAAEDALRAAKLAVDEAGQQYEEAGERQQRVAAERAALGYDPDEHERLRRLVATLELREEAWAAVERARVELDAATTTTTEAALLEERARASVTIERERHSDLDAALGVSVEALAVTAGRARAAGQRLAADAAAADHAQRDAEQCAAREERRAQELDSLTRQVATALEDRAASEAALRAAGGERDATADAQALAAAAAGEAERELVVSRRHRDVAQTEQAAATLQRSLNVGDPCPVCGEPIERLAQHAAPALDAAEAALAEAERVLSEARQTHEARSAASAAAAARSEECVIATARVEARLSGFDVELEAAGLERGASGEALAAAVAQASETAATALGEAVGERDRAHAAQEERHRLELSLAQLPPEMVPREPEALPDTLLAGMSWEGIDDALRSELAQHGGAANAALQAADAVREAEQVARTREVATASARGEVERGRAVLAGAEAALARLASTPAQPAEDAQPIQDAEGVRAALAAADHAAGRAEQLDGAAREASTAFAVAAERLEQRRRDCHQAEAAAQRLGDEAARAVEAAAAALTAFADRWRDVIGADPGADGPSPEALGELTAQLETAARQSAQDLGAVHERLGNARRDAADAARLREEIAGHEQTAVVAGALEQELHADRFIAYVQREALGALATDASTRLLQLTAGRYRLVTEDDQFSVIDRLNGDERRSVRTLSGGETFLASLAMALALSERLPELAGTGGAVSLESLFLDEGFGSLDSDSLDVAIEGLESLTAGRRVVGVISHVPEVAERLPDRIEVVKGDHGSVVRG